MKYINKKRLLILSLSGMVLLNSVACSSVNPNDEKEIENSNEDIVTDNDSIEIEKNINTEEELINYIVTIKEEINTCLQSEDVQKYKEKIIKDFILIVDFIFFDSEIGGYKFDDLTDEAKQKILEVCKDIDVKIEEKFPNYKYDLNEKYKDISAKIKSKYNEITKIILEKLKHKIGEENFEHISDEVKDSAENGIDYAEEQKEKVKEKTLNWYQGIKEKY